MQHKQLEMDFGDSKDIAHLQQIRIQAQNTHTRKITQIMLDTTCIKTHKNLQKHVLESQITFGDLSSHNLRLSLTY
jgi:hypothetical protein